MLWFTLVRKHWLKAATLAATLALILASCPPALNPTASAPWQRGAGSPFKSATDQASSVLLATNVDRSYRAGVELLNDPRFPVSTRDLTPHAPIVISSDQDFADQGWPGSGTPQIPYRIESLEIVFPVGNCIEIRSTTVHFRVQGCRLTGTNQGYGVYLRDTVNGVLENNTCMLGLCGICLENSEDCQVIDNTCLMAVCGIRLNYCQSINVTDNICETSSAAGIRLYESQDVKTVRNQCTGNPYGIEVYGGRRNDVSENTCVSNSAGILLNTTRMFTVDLNDCIWNAIGIWLQDTADSTLTQNTCERNTGPGVLLRRSQFNNVVTNVFDGNRRGIELTSAISNYVAGNLLEHSAESGVYLYLSQSNQIDANIISDSEYGIYAVASQNNGITINTLSNHTQAGILLLESGMNTLVNNTFLGCGLELQGESYLAQTEVRDNTVNGAPLVFLQNQRGAIAPPGAGQVVVLECRSVTIDHQILSGTSIGLLIIYSSFVTVENSIFSLNTKNGVELWGTRRIAFSDNSFIGNRECGIHLHSDCSGNSVRKSAFVNNTVDNAIDDGAFNVFDRNFWSDYLGYDYNLDGLGDVCYFISGQAMNRDWNPLMVPPGVTSPAQLPRWILTVVTALVVNSLIIGIGLSLILRFRKWAVRFARRA